MASDGPQLVFGDDGSAFADVVWSWIENHTWPGWRITAVTAQLPPLGPPLTSQGSSLRPWMPAAPRRLGVGSEVTQVEFLTAEADPRLVLNSFQDAALIAVGPRGHGILKHLHIGSTSESLLHQPPRTVDHRQVSARRPPCTSVR